jgi:cytoskeletal protein CcmA (bactofilin family)
MTSVPKRRLLDKLGGAPSFFGEGLQFIGNVQGAGPFMLCGHINGNGQIDGALNVSASGHWEGEVRATSAVLAGRLTGSIIIAEKLEVGATAVIRGSVTAKSLAIAQGATIDGEITVTGSAPPVHFEEKRK